MRIKIFMYFEKVLADFYIAEFFYRPPVLPFFFLWVQLKQEETAFHLGSKLVFITAFYKQDISQVMS